MTNTLKDWTARPVDLATTAARKAPHSAHLKYGESAAAAYPKECGGVNTERMKLPAGLALADVPFSFTGSGGLRSADRRAVRLDDWRPADAQAREALAAAARLAQEADARTAGAAERIRAAFNAELAAAEALAALSSPYNPGYAPRLKKAERRKLWRARRYGAIKAAELSACHKKAAAADKALDRARASIRYNFGAKKRADRAAQKSGGGADAWALVSPTAARAWLAAAPWRCGAAVASPYNPAFAPRLSDAERARLAAARAESKERAQEVLREEAARLGCGVDALPRIYHYIRVGALDWNGHGGQYDAHIDDWRAANHIRTDTAQAMIAAQCRRWGVAALAAPIRRTGAPYLLELRAQNAEVVRREAAQENAFSALIGGEVRGAAPGAPTGTGGWRYKISVKGTRAAGGAKICYRRRKKKNDFGGFSDTELPLIEKAAAAESAEAQNVATLGRRLTELDAIINSCACPSIPDGGGKDAERVARSLLAWLDRDCVALDDIGRAYFYRRASYGASREMAAERSADARARAAGVQLVSLDQVQEAAAEDGGADVAGAAGVDCSAILWESLKSIARAAAPLDQAAKYEKLFIMRARGATLEEAAAALQIGTATAWRWQKKIISAAASAGADAPLAL